MQMSRTVGFAEVSIRFRDLLLLTLVIGLLTWLKTMLTTQPLVFGDEAIYSLFAKFQATRATHEHLSLIEYIPAHLFYRVYRIAHFFGDNFLAVAKLLNALFIAGSILPIFWLSKLFISDGKALAVAVITAIGPYATFATYFMPESLYFFIFWVYLCCTFFLLRSPIVVQGIIAGLGLGCLALVKPHALALLPCSALMLLLVGARRLDPRANWPRTSVALVVLLAVFMATRLILGFMLTREFGSLTGATYAEFIKWAFDWSVAYATIAEIFFLLQAHLAFLLIIYFLPICLIAWFGLHRLKVKPWPEELSLLFIFFVLALVITLLMAIQRSVYVVGLYADQSLTRLHARYYLFLLPLLFLIALSLFDHYGEQLKISWTKIGSWFFLFIMLGLLVFALVAGEPFRAELNTVDYPDAYFARKPKFFYFWVTVAFIAAFGLLSLRRMSVWPLVSIWAIGMVWAMLVNHEALKTHTGTSFDRTALMIRNILHPNERDAGVIATTYESERAFYALFHLNCYCRGVHLAPGEPLTAVRIGQDRKWVLLTDPIDVAVPHQILFEQEGFKLLALQ